MTVDEIRRKSMEELTTYYTIEVDYYDIMQSIDLTEDAGKRALDEFKSHCPFWEEFKKNELTSEMEQEAQRFATDFLFSYQKYIKKELLVLFSLMNKKQKQKNRFTINTAWNQEESKISKLKELLEKANFYEPLVSTQGGNIEIVILSSREICEDKRSTKNNEKLQELEQRGMDLSSILSFIHPKEDLSIFAYSEMIAKAFLYEAIMNSLINMGIELQELERFDGREIEQYQKDLTEQEMAEALESCIRRNIEYIDFDKMLFVSAFNRIQELEETGYYESPENLSIICAYLKEVERTTGKTLTVRIDQNTRFSVKDIEKALNKFDGDRYWGKATIEAERQRLLEGDKTLDEITGSRVSLTSEEQTKLSIMNDDNYLTLLLAGKLNQNQVNAINSKKDRISTDILSILIEKGLVDTKDVIHYYILSKCELEDIKQFEVLDPSVLTPEYVYDLYNEYKSKDNEEKSEEDDGNKNNTQESENDDKIKRIARLYRNMLEGLKEDEKDQIKDKILFELAWDEDNKKPIYPALEAFIALGTIEFEDLELICDSKDIISAHKNNEISDGFFEKLFEHGLVEADDIINDEDEYVNLLKLWEDGKIGVESIIRVNNYDLMKIFLLCDKKVIKGTKISEMMSHLANKGRDKDYYKFIVDDVNGLLLRSCYEHGLYQTLRPAIAGYNAGLINSTTLFDTIVINMHSNCDEIVELCKEGLLCGQKIAELYLQQRINDLQFEELKKAGRVSDEDEITAGNNLSLEEVIEIAREAGFLQMNMDDVLGPADSDKPGHRVKRNEGEARDAKIILPKIRFDLFGALGTERPRIGRNKGLGGYQVFLIPELKIAIFEKIFRVDRKNYYHYNYGDATYVCEIGKFVQVCKKDKSTVKQERDNKKQQDIADRQNDVERLTLFEDDGSASKQNGIGKVICLNHTKNWADSLINAIAEVNPEIQIVREHGKKGSIIKILLGEEEAFKGSAEIIQNRYSKINKIIQSIQRGESIRRLVELV